MCVLYILCCIGVMSGRRRSELLVLMSLCTVAFTFNKRLLYAANINMGHMECGSRGEGPGSALVVAVTSSPDHRVARRLLRETWIRHANTYKIPYVFVLGIPPDDMATDLLAEATEHGDMVFGEFVDSYRNLTLKSLALLQWAATHCHHARWLLKTDDDVFLNIKHLVKFVYDLDRYSDNNTIYGKVRETMKVDRRKRSRYYVPRSQYRPGVFPRFCRGLGYLLPRGVAGRLLTAARRLPYIPLEDVFITGLAANYVGLYRQNVDYFRDEKKDGKMWGDAPLLAVHTGGIPSRMRRLWRMINSIHVPPPDVPTMPPPSSETS